MSLTISTSGMEAAISASDIETWVTPCLDHSSARLSVDPAALLQALLQQGIYIQIEVGRVFYWRDGVLFLCKNEQPRCPASFEEMCDLKLAARLNLITIWYYDQQDVSVPCLCPSSEVPCDQVPLLEPPIITVRPLQFAQDENVPQRNWWHSLWVSLQRICCYSFHKRPKKSFTTVS
jgi:hypothetical protein